MKILLFLASMCVAICAGLQTEISTSSPNPRVRDLGNEVRGVLASKCAGCHGADVAKPQGRFGYVLDLQRLASNPELVIPWRPAESELWSLVQHDEMPPADRDMGRLRRGRRKSSVSGLPLVLRKLQAHGTIGGHRQQGNDRFNKRPNVQDSRVVTGRLIGCQRSVIESDAVASWILTPSPHGAVYGRNYRESMIDFERLDVGQEVRPCYSFCRGRPQRLRMPVM